MPLGKNWLHTAVKNLSQRIRIPKICAQKQDQWHILVWTCSFRGKKSFKKLIEPFSRKIDFKICAVTLIVSSSSLSYAATQWAGKKTVMRYTWKYIIGYSFATAINNCFFFVFTLHNMNCIVMIRARSSIYATCVQWLGILYNSYIQFFKLIFSKTARSNF